MGFLLPLDIRLELGPTLSTLGGCEVCTLGGGTGTSGGVMLGIDGYMYTLCWKCVGSFPSSSSMTLVCTEGRGLLRSGCTVWGTMVYFSLFAVVDGLLFYSHYLTPWKISWKVAPLRLFGSLRCWKMALEVLGYSNHRLINTPRWWHFMGKNCRIVEYYVRNIQRNLSLLLLLFWWHRRDGTDDGSLRDQYTIPLLHWMPTFLSHLDFHG